MATTERPHRTIPRPTGLDLASTETQPYQPTVEDLDELREELASRRARRNQP